MANPSRISGINAAMSYDVEEVALAMGVTVATVRNWIKSGLPALTSQRPHLIMGWALQAFHQKRRSSAKVPLQPDQLYCLHCRKGQRPDGMLADFVPHTANTGRLVGLCEVCGGICNRMTGRAKLHDLSEIFDMSIRGGGGT